MGRRPVRLGQERFVEFGMQARAQPEQRQHAVVHGDEMSKQVEEAVLPWCHFLLQLVIARGGKDSVEAIEICFHEASAVLANRSATGASGWVITQAYVQSVLPAP